jgi:two-component system, cell cycle response regulator DivK
MLLKGKCIVIVEDNLQNRVVFTMALRLHGAAIEFDRWGEDTLLRLSSFHQVDLIILDLMLPGAVTGYDLFTTIRHLPKYAAVPIIAVSASEPSAAMAKTRQHGFNGFIAKPIDTDLFPKQIANVIAGGSVWFAGEPYEITA